MIRICEKWVGLAVVLLFVMGCRKEEAPCNEMIGPVSCSAFMAVTPPTYEQVIACYEAAVARDPQQPDSALARSVFDCIASAEVQNPAAKPLFDLQSRMCVEEWKLVLRHPREACLAFGNSIRQSLEKAQQEFPQDIDVAYKNAKADAFRNAYMGAIEAKITDTSFARLLAAARLACSQNRMAMHNDTVGVGLVGQYPQATLPELVRLLLERRYYYSHDGLPADREQSLLFSAGRRPFDISYAGTFTNPDGQGTWNVHYYFHQAGTMLRGEIRFAGIQFPDKMTRRFSGLLSQNDITLNISYPYSFEFTPGFTPCRDMVNKLTLAQDSLNGHWTSSNCLRGGLIQLKKQ